MYGCAVVGDKYHIRGPLVIFNAAYGIVGLGMLGFLHNPAARYAGAFLATSSANANVPCVLTWQANNIRGQWKRALASATLVGAGGDRLQARHVHDYARERAGDCDFVPARVEVQAGEQARGGWWQDHCWA
jgi:hypothetical protein